MTHKTFIYAGWWLYLGLIGLGLLLLLAGLGSRVGVWLLLAALLIAAAAALARGWGPHQRLTAELAAAGLALQGEPPGRRERQFFAWNQITGVRLLPRPGYWQTAIRTSPQPDVWLPVGQGLDLAEEIAQVADLPYQEAQKTLVSLGYEHYWQKSGE